MPKLRNAEGDVAKFTQWLARKCRNHNPLSELALVERDRNALPRMYAAKGSGDVKIREDKPEIMVYIAAGRIFEIEVREVTEDAGYEPGKLVDAGF